MKTIAVFLHRGAGWNPALAVREQPWWDEHARFMDGLFEDGVVRLGGPFADGGGSLVVVRAESTEAALAMFGGDPWAQHDVLVAREAREWLVFLDEHARAVG